MNALAVKDMQKLDVTDALSAWGDEYLAQYGGNQHTHRAKKRDLSYLIEALGDPSIASITPSELQHFLKTRIISGDAPATLARRYDNIKRLFTYVSATLDNYKSPMRYVRRPIIPNKPVSKLSIDAIRKIKIAALHSDARTKAIIHIGLSTGLRRDEVVGLDYSHLSKDYTHLNSVKCKHDRFRNVYIPTASRSILMEYLVWRHDQLFKRDRYYRGKRDNYPLFVSFWKAKAGQPESYRMSPETLYRIVKRLGDKAGVKVLHPHMLRDTFAQHLLDTLPHHMSPGKALRIVQQSLGHASVKTTMKYTNQDETEIAEAIEKAWGKDDLFG